MVYVRSVSLTVNKTCDNEEEYAKGIFKAIKNLSAI